MKNFFQQMTLNVLEVGHKHLGPQWDYRNFAQSYIKMYCIMSGKGVVRYPEREIILKPGHAYLIEPFAAADYFLLEAPMEQYYVHFYAKLNANVSIFPLFDFHDVLQHEAPEVLIYLFSRLNHLYEAPNDFTRIEADSILRYLLSLFRKHSGRDLTETLQRIKRFEPVLEYVEEFYAEKVSLQEMADLVHLQPAYFSSAFKKIFGVSPIEFVISKKLEKAQEFLFFTSLSVKEIAHKTGFDDPFYFSRLFKKYLNISPKQYRLLRR